MHSCGMSMSEAFWRQLQGVPKALVQVLESGSREVQVRALLCLGMLLGGNQQQQIELAEVAGALPQLLQLRLQTDDEDCKQIADGIVAAMVSYAYWSA